MVKGKYLFMLCCITKTEKWQWESGWQRVHSYQGLVVKVGDQVREISLYSSKTVNGWKELCLQFKSCVCMGKTQKSCLLFIFSHVPPFTF